TILSYFYDCFKRALSL
ncbi:hypothetical protein RDABS01_034265, partial [Bienertia sinuspersici]